MKRVSLYLDPRRGVWTHDPSGFAFVSWEADRLTPEGEPNPAHDPVSARASLEATMRKTFAKYYTGLPGHAPVSADEVELDLQNAPERFTAPPVEVNLTNFQAARPSLAADADAAVAGGHSPRALKPTGRMLA